MNAAQTAFAQVIAFASHNAFHRCVRRYPANCHLVLGRDGYSPNLAAQVILGVAAARGYAA